MLQWIIEYAKVRTSERSSAFGVGVIIAWFIFGGSPDLDKLASALRQVADLASNLAPIVGPLVAGGLIVAPTTKKEP